MKQQNMTVLAYADVQENGDGTWTAVVYLNDRANDPAHVETRDEALMNASSLASVKPIPPAPPEATKEKRDE